MLKVSEIMEYLPRKAKQRAKPVQGRGREESWKTGVTLRQFGICLAGFLCIGPVFSQHVLPPPPINSMSLHLKISNLLFDFNTQLQLRYCFESQKRL